MQPTLRLIGEAVLNVDMVGVAFASTILSILNPAIYHKGISVRAW